MCVTPAHLYISAATDCAYYYHYTLHTIVFFPVSHNDKLSQESFKEIMSFLLGFVRKDRYE